MLFGAYSVRPLGAYSVASRRTLCLGDAWICSSSEVNDTDERDIADVVWYVHLFPRAVVFGALLS